MIHVIGSQAKEMCDYNSKVTITKGQNENQPIPDKNLSMHLHFANYNKLDYF